MHCDLLRAHLGQYKSENVLLSQYCVLKYVMRVLQFVFLFCMKEYWQKAARNVGEIDPCSQFHQHFTCTFFEQKNWRQKFKAKT